MSFLHPKKPEREVSLVFDIGSGSVGAAVLSCEEGSLPKILYTVREPLSFMEQIDPERLMAQMETALGKVSLAIRKDGLPRVTALEGGRIPRRISHALVTFCAPWYVSETKTLTVENIKPFVFSRAFADDLLAKEESSFEQREKVIESETVCFEKKLIGVRLDGYQSRDPYGLRTKKAEVSAYWSLAPRRVLEKVRAILDSHFEPREIAFSSFPQIAYEVICKKAIPESDAVIIDVNRELTELSLVKKGLLLEISSFPLGKNFLVRDAAAALRTTPESALSELRMYWKDMSEAKHREKISAILGKAQAKWLQSFEQALGQFSGNYYLPSAFYLVSQSDFIPFFTACFESATIPTGTIGELSYCITTVGEKILAPHIAYGDGVEKDIFLSMIGLFHSMRLGGSRM